MAHLRDVGARKLIRDVREVEEVDVIADRALAQVRLEDGDARVEIGQRNVDELVEPPGAHDCGVEDVGTIRRSDHEDTLR